jgi:hypothetical protein
MHSIHPFSPTFAVILLEKIFEILPRFFKPSAIYLIDAFPVATATRQREFGTAANRG